MNKNTIIWEKWKDPFGMDTEDVQAYDDIGLDDEDDEDSYILKYKKIKKVQSHVIATPFGIIPINENTASGEIFNFWTGHTNFALTNNIAQIIENTEGIETLNIFTKYRFRIGIGKAFKDSDVMRDVNYNVYSYLNYKYYDE